MEVGEIIAFNLKRLRSEKNLSLGQLAEMAGVSKVMLSNVEKGDGNPTINTLWKIAKALEVPYTQLLDLPDKQAIHVKKKDIHPQIDDKLHLFSYYKKEAGRNFEMYEAEIEVEGIHKSIGHSTNSYEYLYVIEGRLEIETNNEKHILEKEDGFCFDGATPHTYKNISNEIAKLMMIIYFDE